VNDTQQPRYLLTTEAEIPMSPTAVVLLDAGPTSPVSIWDRVVQSIGSPTVLIVIADYSPAAVTPASPWESLASTIDRIEKQHTSIDRRILVGSTSGCSPVQLTIIQRSSIATDLILIDPDPLLPAGLADTAAPLILNELIHIPTTIILHGAGPRASSSHHRSAAQEREFYRFSNRREILAGRSRTCILTERPDVVVDAIASALAREINDT
jgi:hypothetical protein